VVTVSYGDASLEWREEGQAFGTFITAQYNGHYPKLEQAIVIGWNLARGRFANRAAIVEGLAKCLQGELIEEILGRLNPAH
jgi:hypothetical protein